MKNVLVIGDACRDEFVYCNCTKLCPEAPVPLLQIVTNTSNTGMAGNVANNLSALFVGVSNIFPKNYSNVTKTRYVDIKTNHMFIRIDNNEPSVKFNREQFSNYINHNAGFFDAVVISDYNKGFLSEDDIKYITSIVPLSFIDTKKQLGDWVKNTTFIKINEHEYNSSKQYIEQNNLKVIQTAGSNGCFYNGKHYPVNKVGVIDVSGAGDTFLAGLVCEYLKTNNIELSIIFANKCAQQVVQKPGVSIVTLDEIN